MDEILSLPHDSLRRDLENILLFNIGLSCNGIPKEMSDAPFSGVIARCMMLLGEVGNDSSSLNTVLEVLRQSDDFLDYHIDDRSMEIIVPTIYKLAKNRLDVFVSDLINIDAIEIMSEIKTMYDNGFVDLMACGDFAAVEKAIIRKEYSPSLEIKLNIKERYGLLHKCVE